MCNYFDTYNKKDCNGCGTCALKCPKGAITMEEDYEGFYYPIIDKTKCVKCNICKKICSNNPKNIDFNSKVYVAINRNKKELMNSSSGGIFAVLAKYVLNKNGIVFGATMDKNFVTKHIFIDNYNDLTLLQGTKYVRSKLENTYKNVNNFLNKKKIVLFTGTPCQCMGLKKYLGKEYDNLITCELLCHANPSPLIFNMYLDNLRMQKKYKNGINKVIFRDKNTGWKNQSTTIIDKSFRKTENDLFYKAFTGELINRPSCNNCKYKKIEKYSDFTIGDAWRLDRINVNIKDDNTGISLLFLNTDRSKKIFKELEDNIIYEEITKEELITICNFKNYPIHCRREKFFIEVKDKRINSKNISKKMKIYLDETIMRKIYKKVKMTLLKVIK